MLRHVKLDHDSELQNFTMSVTGMYRIDCMLRQIAEGVSQGNAPEGTLINTKKEWNYIHLSRVIIDNN